MRLSLLLSAAVLVLGLGGCRQKQEADVPAAPAPPPAPKLIQFRQEIQAAYRLRPDARFLSAVGEVHHFLTGEARQPVGADFSEGKWRVRYAGRAVGELSPLPDFPEALALLTRWADALARERKPGVPLARFLPAKVLRRWGKSPMPVPLPEGRHPEIAAQVDQFFPPQLFSAAHALNQIWAQGTYDAESLRLGTRALVFLSLQTPDSVETADFLQARALAFLALCKAVTPHALPQEEALLAETLGYRGHARKSADALPEDDPVRLSILGQDQPLEETARKDKAAPEARYLYLMRLAEKRDADPWQEWAAGSFPEGGLLPVLKTFPAPESFDARLRFGRTLLEAVLRQMSPDSRPSDLEIKNFLVELSTETPVPTASRFNAALGALKVESQGPFLDASLLEAYYQSHFYSALCSLGLEYLAEPSSATASRDFLRVLGEVRHGPEADFKNWYEHLAGPVSPEVLQKDLKDLKSLGAAPLLTTFQGLKKRLREGDPRLFEAVKAMAARLDSRPRHRYALGRLAFQDLLDPALAAELYSSALDAQGFRDRSARAWWADFMGDRKALEDLLQEPGLEPWEGVEALKLLEKQEGASPDFLHSGYKKFLAQSRDRWDVTREYIGFLERAKDFKQAREVAAHWLSLNKDTSTVHALSARIRLAGLYERAGKYIQALQSLQPVLKSGSWEVVLKYAVVLDKAGRPAEAQKAAEQVLKQHPHNFQAAVVLAELHWRHGRHPQAAKLLKERSISMAQWRGTLAPLFLEIFQADPSAGLQAAQALLDLGMDRPALAALAREAQDAGLHALAFEIQSRLHAGGWQGLDFLTVAYGYLKDWKGEAAALNWLKARVPEKIRNPLCLSAFGEGRYEVLWEVIPSTPSGPGEDYVWLLRAAAAIPQEAAKDPHRPAVEGYFQSSSSAPYHLLGRYLLGKAQEPEALALVQDPKSFCEAAFFLGWKAQAEGRYAEAAAWYRAALETGQETLGEYRWAYRQLDAWMRRGKSLERLAAESGKTL